MPPPKSKKGLQSFLSTLNYLSKFSPVTAEVWKLLQELTSVKAGWMWYGMYQDLYDKTKKIVKNDLCMKVYYASRPLQLESDASGVGPQAGLWDGMNCGCDEVTDNVNTVPYAY